MKNKSRLLNNYGVSYMKIMSIILTIATLVGFSFVIVKNVISIIKTLKNKKSNQDIKGGDN